MPRMKEGSIFSACLDDEGIFGICGGDSLNLLLLSDKDLIECVEYSFPFTQMQEQAGL